MDNDDEKLSLQKNLSSSQLIAFAPTYVIDTNNQSKLSNINVPNININLNSYSKSNLMSLDTPEMREIEFPDIDNIRYVHYKLYNIEFINNLHYNPNVFYKNNKKNIIIANFKNTIIKRSGWGHNRSLILFKPILNDIFKNKNIESHRIHLRMIKNNCNNAYLKDGGYYFEFGLILIQKDKNHQNNVNIDKLKNFENIIKNSKYFENGSCALQDIMEKDESFQYIQSFYIKFGCRPNYNPSYNYCYFGKNNNQYYSKLYHTKDNKIDTFYHINGNQFNNIDDISLVVTKQYDMSKYNDDMDDVKYNENTNLYNLYFCKNNQIIGESTNYKEIQNGRIQLDFEKYYYYGALSSIRCNCEGANMNGFEFEVEM